jgi:hypothetical protein
VRKVEEGVMQSQKYREYTAQYTVCIWFWPSLVARGRRKRQKKVHVRYGRIPTLPTSLVPFLHVIKQ